MNFILSIISITYKSKPIFILLLYTPLFVLYYYCFCMLLTQYSIIYFRPFLQLLLCVLFFVHSLSVGILQFFFLKWLMIFLYLSTRLIIYKYIIHTCNASLDCYCLTLVHKGMGKYMPYTVRNHFFPILSLQKCLHTHTHILCVCMPTQDSLFFRN